MQEKKKTKLDFAIQNQSQFCDRFFMLSFVQDPFLMYFHQIEGIEFIYDETNFSFHPV